MLNIDEISELVENQHILKSDMLDNDLILFRNSASTHYDRKSSFQPGSIDLHVGNIYVPDRKSNPVKSISLEPGNTILFETQEICDFPSDIGGICFASASKSLEGLLIINIGHIDPGYKGNLHFTILNLGKEPINIFEGSSLITMLLYRCTPPKVNKKFAATIDSSQILPKLSGSFMDYEKTIKREIKQASFITPLLVTIITIALATIITSISSAFIERNKLEHSIELIKTEYNMKIDSLEREVAELKDKISSIQNTTTSPPPNLRNQ